MIKLTVHTIIAQICHSVCHACSENHNLPVASYQLQCFILMIFCVPVMQQWWRVAKKLKLKSFPKPDTSRSCKSTDTGLVCHVECLFSSQLAPLCKSGEFYVRITILSLFNFFYDSPIYMHFESAFKCAHLLPFIYAQCTGLLRLESVQEQIPVAY